jgi:predicted outer membrane lipoprotein
VKSGEPVVQEGSSEPPKGLYASADEALKKIQETYDYWSGKLNDITMQMALALIGANWAIFVNVNGILAHIWAKLSIIAILLAVVFNVIAALALSEMTEARVTYAESDLPRWDREYKESTGQKVAWPFTDSINDTGRRMRWVRAALIVISGVCLIIGAILK